jgi:hypothetical protein
MTDVRGADAAALAAYAAHHDLDGEEAAAEWRFAPERERAHWGRVAAERHSALAAMRATEPEDAGPQSLADARKRYRQIAKAPEPSDTDPGGALGKYLTMTGLRHAFLADWSPEDEKIARLAMGAALLWRRLLAADPGRAELTAGQIATAWAAGDGPAEWLHTLAVRSGIDPDEVMKAAATERALLFVRQADGGKTPNPDAAGG